MHTATRRHQSASRPPISYPLGADRAEGSSAGHQLYRPVSPPKTPPRNRRPSVTVANPMSWLSRNSGHTKDAASAPAPAAPAKPVRISEPKFANALDLMMAPRTGALGSGATVVRTPHDALGGTSFGMYRDSEDAQVLDIGLAEDEGRDEDAIDDNSPTLPRDPRNARGLPPLPLTIGHPYRTASVDENASRRDTSQARAAPPTRAPPAPPAEEQSPMTPPSPGPSTLRPSLKSQFPSSSEYFPPVPTVPSHLTGAPPQPPFEPILISPVPSTAIDPSKIIVTLESSTVAHRTALSTLVSRPSHLAVWLGTVFKNSKAEECGHADDEDDTRSMYSRASDASGFFSIFHNHLNNAGLLSPTSSSMHIFLDRPSAPYAHILSYLRSPTSAPAALPRAAQLTSSSSSRLEALLELRDEAVYLGLDELAKLCTDELSARCRSRTTSHSSHAHTHSQSSSLRAFPRTTSSSSLAHSARAPPPAEPSPLSSDASGDGSDGSSGSESGSPGGSRRDSTGTLATVCAAPDGAEERAHAGSHGSLVALYDHSPVAAAYPRRPSPAAAAAASAPDVPALLRARVAAFTGASVAPPARPPVTPGLQQRFAQMRARTEAGKFNSVKTRPPAEWI